MMALTVLAVLATVGQVLLVRRFRRDNLAAVFFFIAALVFSGAVFVTSFPSLWRMRAALTPRFHDGRVWIWRSVWYEAAHWVIYLLVGIALVVAVVRVRRTPN